jgi:hypothetical protein
LLNVDCFFQVLRMHMKVKEDIDTGWEMLGLEEVENPKPLQDLVDKVVAVLNILRRLQLRVTFESLGLNVHDGCSRQNVQTDDTVTELAEQYTNSQVFTNACVSEEAIQNEEAERQRQVMRNHIASHAPVVGNLDLVDSTERSRMRPMKYILLVLH